MSDEVVYYEQVSNRHPDGITGLNGRRTYIKEYLGGKLWLEILFKIRKLHKLELYCALIEAFETIDVKELIGTRQASGNRNLGCSRQDDAMFVNDIKPVKNPQGMPKLLPIRSLIRLNWTAPL